MRHFFQDLRNIPKEIRWFFAGALCLGIGQQIFVVVRNPWLVDLGYASHQVTPVQAAGAFAGVFVGFFAIYATRKWSPRTLFLLCAFAQGCGFLTQVAMPLEMALTIAGGAIAGFGIQLHTAIAPAYLRQVSDAKLRTTVFSAWSLSFVVIAGILGALSIGLISFFFLKEQAQTASLLFAAVITTLAIVPWLHVKKMFATSPNKPTFHMTKGILIMLTIHGLLGLAGGLVIPFLQLYFKMRFGVSPFGIATIYAFTMLISVIAHIMLPSLVHRFGLWQTTMGFLASAIPYLIVMALSPWLLLAMFAFLGRHVCSRTGMPLLHQLGQELLQKEEGTQLASQIVLVASGSWALGNLLAGPLFQLANGKFLFVFGAACLLYFLTILFGLKYIPPLWRQKEEREETKRVSPT